MESLPLYPFFFINYQFFSFEIKIAKFCDASQSSWKEQLIMFCPFTILLYGPKGSWRERMGMGRGQTLLSKGGPGVLLFISRTIASPIPCQLYPLLYPIFNYTFTSGLIYYWLSILFLYPFVPFCYALWYNLWISKLQAEPLHRFTGGVGGVGGDGRDVVPPTPLPRIAQCTRSICCMFTSLYKYMLFDIYVPSLPLIFYEG